MAESQLLGVWFAAFHLALSITPPNGLRMGIRQAQRAGMLHGVASATRMALGGGLMNKKVALALLLALSIILSQIPGSSVVQPVFQVTPSQAAEAHDVDVLTATERGPDREQQTEPEARAQAASEIEPAAASNSSTPVFLGEDTTAPFPAISSSSMSFSSASLLAFQERPLEELSPDAQAFLEGRSGKWGVAVVVPSQKTIYTYNGDELSPMASVAKVAIMLTTMDRAISEGRDLTDRELRLLRPMITQSDNDAADILWSDLGGGSAVEAYLRSIGITDIVPNQSDAWGASRASAKAVALLLADVAFGDILDQPMRDLAMELLSDVIPSQRWGVTAGTASEPPAGTVIGVKDGWYPAKYAWWVNSTGMLIPADGRPPYTIAVLSRGQPSMEYGIATIEGVAQPVHDALHHPQVAKAN